MPVQIMEGFATADATGAHAKRFDALSYKTLGRTGLHCSQAGLGCYRIADGESETLVGKVLTDAIESGTLSRAAIIVVTKGGYLQGRNYALSQITLAPGKKKNPLRRPIHRGKVGKFIVDILERQIHV